MRVRAPGSSANLGPGFDVLGMAVARYVWASDRGEGEPCGPGHIARIAYEWAGGDGPIWFDFELEPGRGLGFSAAARAAGAYLACRQHGLDTGPARQAAYEVVAEIEGHGDNAAPAVFGGIHVIAGQHQHRLSADLPGTLLFWVPELETPTDASRAEMADMVPRADAVYNLGRVGLLMAALYEQRLDLLGPATADRLHQPQRLAACPAAAAAYRAAVDAGVAAVWLSGSGPTLALVVADGQAESVCRAMPSDGRILRLAVDSQGVVADPAPSR